MTTEEIQAVYDEAFALGILEEPMTAPQPGVIAARIDTTCGCDHPGCRGACFAGDAVLVETVKARL